MRQASRARFSLLWVGVGIAVGLIIAALALPALLADGRPAPLATYPVTAMDQTELREQLSIDGVMNSDNMDVVATSAVGPDGQLVVWGVTDQPYECMYRLREAAGMDFYSCTVRGWSQTYTLPIDEFSFDDDLVRTAAELGATHLFLVYDADALSVWPIGPGLPTP